MASTSGPAAAAPGGVAGAAAAASGAGAAAAAAPSKRPGSNLPTPREAAAKLKQLLPVGRPKTERAELLERDPAAAPAASPAGASTSGGGGWTAGKGKASTVTRSASEIKRAYGRPGASAAGRWAGGRAERWRAPARGCWGAVACAHALSLPRLTWRRWQSILWKPVATLRARALLPHLSLPTPQGGRCAWHHGAEPSHAGGARRAPARP